MTIDIDLIALRNGNVKNAGIRTAMTETGLPRGTMVEFLEIRDDPKNRSYRESLYRIVGTNDLIIVRRNNSTEHCLTWDSVTLIKGYFSEDSKENMFMQVRSKKTATRFAKRCKA